MTVEEANRPKAPGNWSTVDVRRTGAWTIGTIWIDREAGRYALEVEARHCNATEKMHGGAMATLLDAQCIVGNGHDADAPHTPTITLHVDYLAPAEVGDWLVTEVEQVKTTRTMIVTQAITRVGDRVVARSSAIYSNTRGKDAP